MRRGTLLMLVVLAGAAVVGLGVLLAVSKVRTQGELADVIHGLRARVARVQTIEASFREDVKCSQALNTQRNAETRERDSHLPKENRVGAQAPGPFASRFRYATDGVRWRLEETALTDPPQTPRHWDIVGSDGKKVYGYWVDQGTVFVSAYPGQDLAPRFTTSLGFLMLETPLQDLDTPGLKAFLAGAEYMDGEACCHVVGQGTFRAGKRRMASRLDLWVAPEKAFAVKRYRLSISHIGEGPFSVQDTMSEGLVEKAPGIWLPTRVQQTWLKLIDGQLQPAVSRTYTILDLKVNQPLDKSLFVPVLRKGMVVIDKTTGTQKVL